MSDAAPAAEAAGDDGKGGVRALVVGHGEFAAGLVSAGAHVTGLDAAFLALSNRGMSREQLEQMLRDALDRTGAGTVFTDLPAGSGTLAARRVQRDRPSLVVVTGANVAMLLEFAMRTAVPPAEAAAAAADRGREAITMPPAPAAPSAPGAAATVAPSLLGPPGGAGGH